MMKTIKIDENKILRKDDTDDQKQECFNYITNKLWDDPRKSEFADKNKFIHLYFNPKSDNFFCFLDQEIPQTKYNKKSDVLLNYVNKFDLNACNLEKKYHQDCDPNTSINRMDEIILYSLFLHPKKWTSPPFPSGLPHPQITNYKPIPIFIFSENKIDFFNPKINPFISLQQLFDILCLINKNKVLIKNCYTKRENVKYACLYKLEKGDPDEGHNFQIKMMKFIYKLDLFNKFNFMTYGLPIIKYKNWAESVKKDIPLNKDEIDLFLNLIASIEKNIPKTGYNISVDPSILLDLNRWKQQIFTKSEKELDQVYDEGFDEGFRDGEIEGFNKGKDIGYEIGFNQALEEYS